MAKHESEPGTVGKRQGRPKRFLMTLLFALAVLALFASSCGSDDDSGDDANDATTTSTEEPAEEQGDEPAEEQADEPAEEASGPAPSGTIRSAPAVSLITLDPHNFSGGGLSWLTPVYETLFRRTLDADTVIEPLLATGFEQDGLIVTITLRDDVTFSDGEAFNAAAVKANLERGKEVGIRSEFGTIDSVEVVDEFTVAVTLAQASPGFIADMASIPGMMISPGAMDDPALDRNPVGTGPWVYNAGESREGDVHAYTLNENYWDPSAQGVERIEVYDIPDATARLNALKTGQIDIATVAGPQAAEVAADSSLGTIPQGANLVLGLPILDRAGTVVPAFAIPEVRQAMSLAIDREAWSAAVDFGFSEPNLQPVPKGHWAHNDALDANIEYDPEKARQLLADAGFPDGFSFTMPSIGAFASFVEVLGEFWRDVGIDMEVEVLEPGTLAGRSRTTDFPITMLYWVVGTDISNYEKLYLAEDAAFNPFGVPPNPRITELNELGSESLDPTERAPFYQEMMELVVEDAFIIYITSSTSVLGSTAELAENPTIRMDAAQAEVPIWHGLRLDG